MSQTYQTYQVKQGDSLPGIASRFLGSAQRWREIAALNKLRSPFISDSPADWYGTPVAVGVLTDSISDGDTEVVIPGENGDLLIHNAVLFLDGQDEDGFYVYAAPRIDSYDESTGTVYLREPIVNGWLLGGRYRICPPAEDIDTIVARSGSTIALPIPVSQGASQVIEAGELIDLFGTDILLPPDGKLRWVGGDLSIISGIPNAEQALRFRAALPYGEALWHPEEGNKAHTLIGEPISPATAQIAALYTRAALATDPRVAEIPQVAGAQDGLDSIAVTATVLLIDNNRQVRINAIIKDRA